MPLDKRIDSLAENNPGRNHGLCLRGWMLMVAAMLCSGVMIQNPDGRRPGGIIAGSTTVRAGDPIEIVVTDGTRLLEVIKPGIPSVELVPVPVGGVVSIPTGDVPPGGDVFVSDGRVNGSSVNIKVLPRSK